MAAVALAWESQSTRRVGCSAAARQAARFTAVVVLPTPPFWFATAMIRANYSPAHRKSSKRSSRMQDVSRGTSLDHANRVRGRNVPCGTFALNLGETYPSFHVEQTRPNGSAGSLTSVSPGTRPSSNSTTFHVEHPSAVLCRSQAEELIVDTEVLFKGPKKLMRDSSCPPGGAVAKNGALEWALAS